MINIYSFTKSEMFSQPGLSLKKKSAFITIRTVVFLSVSLVLLSLLQLTNTTSAGSGDNYPEPWRSDGISQHVDSWGYYSRNCTSWVAWALHDRNGFTMPRGYGNASNWGYAADEKYDVNYTPAAGSVAWWVNENHVAWVKSVSGDKVTIEEYNYNNSGKYSIRDINKSEAIKYIHFDDLALDDYNNDGDSDIYAINRKDFGTNSTALHVLSGVTPSVFLLSKGTVLQQTNSNWDFALGNRNADSKADLYAIDRRDIGSNSTAIHVVNGENMNQYLWHTGTVLHKTDLNWSFAVADYNKDGVDDLYAINRKDAGSNKTALHVIDGANPNRYLLHYATALHQTDLNWSFAVADYNKDGVDDLYAINKKDAGSGKTAVHVMNGRNLGQFLLHTATWLHQTDANWEFAVKDYNRDSNPDIYAINKKDAGSGKTAIHVINGANFNQALLSKATGLHQTNSEWSFR